MRRIVLMDGMSGAEEGLMEKIGDRTDLFFVGGSAGDDLKFQNTQVMADGKAYTNAAVLLTLELKI
ncbi:MAG: FIST N-terminal domain-containing protein [Bryobacteraceae bacterium]